MKLGLIYNHDAFFLSPTVPLRFHMQLCILRHQKQCIRFQIMTPQIFDTVYLTIKGIQALRIEFICLY
jgi:hypothetical protein